MKRKRALIAGIVIAALIILVALLFFGAWQIPPIAEQVPLDAAPIQVRITSPAANTTWPLNRNVLVQAIARGPHSITRMDLYINNQLFKSIEFISPSSDGESTTGSWDWLSGGEGQYILVVHAQDNAGNSGISQPVKITADRMALSASLIAAEDGNTLKAVAKAFDVRLKDAQQANPDIDPKEPLASGEWVLLPIAADPPEDDLIPGFYQPDGEESVHAAEPEDMPDWDEIQEIKPNIWKDVLFYFQKPDDPAVPDPSETDSPEQVIPPGLPGTPVNLEGKYEDCNVMIRFDVQYFFNSSDPAPTAPAQEEGFFMYRSRDGKKFKRIATLPEYTDGQPDNSAWTYADEDQYGLVTYYISAFNKNGESPSAPISFPLDQMNCKDPAESADPFAPHFDDEYNLVLPFNLDTAYLYIQINDSQGERVPEGDRFFLPGSGIKFNLNGYLADIVDDLQLTDMKINIEVWGWLGGNLVYAGDLEEHVHRSILTVCSREGQNACTTGGAWVGDMTIIGDNVLPLVEQTYDIRWQSTALSKTDKVCLVITPRDFYGPGLRDTSFTLLYTCYYDNYEWGKVEGNEGYYSLDFSKLLYPEDPASVPNSTLIPGEDYQNPDFSQNYPAGTPFSLHLRAIPVMDDAQFNAVSNTAVMRYFTSAMPPDMPPLASNVPSMYDVEILEDTYRPPRYEIWEKWGCVIIDEDPTGKYTPGTEVCPLSYYACGENVECEDGFLNVISAAFDYVVGLINQAKGAIAGAIADAIPGCGDSSTCRDVVSKGIDYGVSALTGLPPDLPNFDEFVSQSIADYITGELAGIGGPGVEYVCGDICRNEITEQIQPYVEQARSIANQPWCSAGGGRYGKYPECFAPPVKVHPAPGSGDFPGYVSVRVTRKSTPESLAATSEDGDKVRLWLTVDGENDARIGYYGHEYRYMDNVPPAQLPDPDKPNSLANFDYFYLGDEAMREPLFEEVQVEIPWLALGESTIIPLRLNQFRSDTSKGIQTARSQYLFFRGSLHMTAAEYCYSSDSSWEWVPCTNGGQDTWSFANPETP